MKKKKGWFQRKFSVKELFNNYTVKNQVKKISNKYYT